MKWVSLLCVLLMIPLVNAGYQERVDCSESGGWIQDVIQGEEILEFCHCRDGRIWEAEKPFSGCYAQLTEENVHLLTSQQKIDSLRQRGLSDIVEEGLGDILLKTTPYIGITIIIIGLIEFYRRKKIKYWDENA